MRTFMLALFIALLLVVLGGFYLANPAVVAPIRLVVVVALGVLGVISYIIYEKVRAAIAELHRLRRQCAQTVPGWGDPTNPPPAGQPPEF